MWLLSETEMAEVQGDKDACLAVIKGFGSCKGCSAHCHDVAKEQLKKVVEKLDEEGMLDHDKRSDGLHCTVDCRACELLKEIGEEE